MTSKPTRQAEPANDSGQWNGLTERRRPHPMPLGRRVLMLAIIVGVLIGFTLLVWLAVDVRKLTHKARIPSPEDLARAALLFRMLSILIGVSVLGAALWIGHFAWRVKRDGVYPPPGSRHMRVRRVLRGAEAERVATICFVLAGLLALAGVALVPLVFRLLASLGLPVT